MNSLKKSLQKTSPVNLRKRRLIKIILLMPSPPARTLGLQRPNRSVKKPSRRISSLSIRLRRTQRTSFTAA